MQSNGNSDQKTGAPRVWIVQSPHSGDNTQLRALAAGLGWPSEVKQLAYRGPEPLLRLMSRASLAGIDLARSSPLAPPWPDLVICSGRGAEAVAFWIRVQHPACRLVFIGTPWAAHARFDLIITTPQYRLPQAPNVLHNRLPLHDAMPDVLAAAAAAWAERLAQLPRPFTAVLVGGRSGPYLMTPQAAARLGRMASDMAKADGGSLLITTSARTSPAAADALADAISVPCHLHRWAGAMGENPFHAFLGLAHRIIVTADSVSMMAEAVSTGKPVLLFDIEEGRYAMRAEERSAGAPAAIGWRGRSLDATLFRLLINHAPPRFSRDLRIIHRQLVSDGHAQWLGDPPRPAASLPPEDGLARAVARIRGLFGL